MVRSFFPVSPGRTSDLGFFGTGSSVAVFGIISNTTDAGSIVLSYSVDSEKATTTVSLTNGTTRPVPMAQLFSVDVPDGLHTLVVNVTFVLNLRQIGIDFVTYNASFESIDSIPSSPSASATPVSATSSSKTMNVGAIVGGVVGGIVFVALLALFLYILKKRAHQRRRIRAAAAIIGRNYNPHLGKYPVVTTMGAF